MNTPRADRDIQQALATWMDAVAPDQAPTRLLEDTFGQTMKTPQARAWPWHRIALGDPPLAVVGSSTRIAFVVLGALLVLALAAVLIGGGNGQTAPAGSPAASPTGTAGAASPALPAAVSITAEATVPLQGPIALVVDGAFLWALAPGRLDQIDPATNAVTGTVPLGAATDLYNGLAANDAGLWATDWEAALLWRVDPVTRKVVASIPAGFAPKGVLANADGVWVADTHYGTVLRIDAGTNKVIATTTVGPTGPSGPNWLASGLGSVWVDIPNTGTIVRIDPATDSIQATIKAPVGFAPCGGFAIEPAAVWLTACSDSWTLARIDPATNLAVATVGLPGYGFNPILIDGFPWISIDTGDATSGLLARIDPATNLIDRVIVPSAPFGGGGDIVVAAGSVWVVDGYNNVLLRLPLAAFSA